MAQKANFPFKEKEGKFFAPIVGQTNVVNGKVQPNPVPKAGVKGAYAMVRLELPATVEERTELYAISTEVFTSSR